MPNGLKPFGVIRYKHSHYTLTGGSVCSYLTYRASGEKQPPVALLNTKLDNFHHSCYRPGNRLPSAQRFLSNTLCTLTNKPGSQTNERWHSSLTRLPDTAPIESAPWLDANCISCLVTMCNGNKVQSNLIWVTALWSRGRFLISLLEFKGN